MHLQSLRAHHVAPRRSGSIEKYLEALVRWPGGSGRFACRFRTDLHFADDALGGRDRVNSEMHSEDMTEPVRRFTWRL